MLQKNQFGFILNKLVLLKIWIRLKTSYKAPQKEWNVWKMTQLVLKLKKEEKLIKERAIRLGRFLNGNQERKIYMDFQIPEKADVLELHYWNADSDKLILIDNLEVFEINSL